IQALAATPPRSARRVVVLAAALTLLAGCNRTRTVVERVPGSPRIPPAPPLATGSPNGSQPPVVWVGGVLVGVTADHVAIREDPGGLVMLQRLAAGATQF